MSASFETSTDDPKAWAGGAQILDRVHLCRMALGDRSLEAEVLGLFLQQSERLAEKAANAEGRELAVLAHTLMGSAKAVGAWRVADCAERLEAAACAGKSGDSIAPVLAQLRQAVQEVNAVIGRIVLPA